jgi:hypothetical protein
LKAAAVLSALAASGCALHLQVPEIDPRLREPVAPAAEPSHVAAVARVPFSVLADLIERRALPPVERGGNLGFAQWRVHAAREGRVSVRGENEWLCFAVPFRGQGHIATALGQIERLLRVSVDVCAVPRLDADAGLRFDRPVARVLVDQGGLVGPAQVLAQIASEQIQAFAGAQLTDYVRDVRVPTSDALRPVLASLERPFPLPDGACLRLRPLRVRIGQPGVDPGTLRLAASLECAPTVDQPCAGAQALRPPAPPPLLVDDTLQHPPARLNLPIAFSLERIEREAATALRKLGRIALANGGWLEVHGLKLHTAKGAVLAEMQVAGEVKDRWLGLIPVQRKVDGELALWGVPQVDEAGLVSVRDLQVELTSGDALVAIGAALQRSRVVALLGERLRIEPRQVRAEVDKAIAGLQRKVVAVGTGADLPVRIDVREAKIAGVKARGGRLEVETRFAGHVVVGETSAQ